MQVQVLILIYFSFTYFLLIWSRVLKVFCLWEEIINTVQVWQDMYLWQEFPVANLSEFIIFRLCGLSSETISNEMKT